jgi:hypothetical protein
MSKKKKIDFSDEEAVLAEVAHDLEVDIEEVTIEEDSGLSSFGTGTIYRIGEGRREYMVVEDSDQMRALALAVVKQDLEDEPEIFTQSWLEGHIDTDRLRRDLESDVQNERYEYLKDMRISDFWEEAERYGMDSKWIVNWSNPSDSGQLPGVFSSEDDAIEAGDEWKRDMVAADPDPDEAEDAYDFDVYQEDPDDSDIQALAENMTEELLKDPMSYLEDIYGKEDAVKEAIRIAGIDIDAAAEDAVDTDGAEHFLAHYDGNSYETKSGLVYWRTN